jgi:hypothetical protein
LRDKEGRVWPARLPTHFSEEALFHASRTGEAKSFSI